MLKGKTILQLCDADMVQAVEFWLNEKLLKEPAKVLSVKSNPDGNYNPKGGFIISLQNSNEEDESQIQ